MLRNISLTHGLILAAAITAVGFTGVVRAADISWSATVVDTTDGDSDPGAGLGNAAVSTLGTLVEAANFGTLDDVVVNGVTFNGVDFDALDGELPTNLSIAYDSADGFPSFGSGGTSTGETIDDLTVSFSRDNGVNPQTALLTGLTPGQPYLVQFIASFAGINRGTTFDDGNGSNITQSTNDPHSFSTGVFTADATTQTVIMTASAGSQFLSGYQLRAIPEPSSLMLLGLVGLTAMVRRQRG